MAEKFNKNQEAEKLKSYLLGNIGSDSEKGKIEERLMTDDDYFQELSMQEDALIQSYADETLTSDELIVFEKHFLISVERRKKVLFARALRSFVDDETPSGDSIKVKEKRDFWTFFQFLTSPAAAVAGLFLIFSIALSIWYFYPRPTNTELALASLNQAYKTERPVESRITDFDYAPFSKVRGGADDKTDVSARNRAERILLDEAAEKPSAAVFHSLGRLYLTKKDFDEAVKQLDKARRLAPQTAEIFSDLGTAYLEKSKTLAEAEKRMELQAQALENFDKAVEINPLLLPAQFNRAYSLQLLNLPNQAREAWQNYLKLDSASEWAKEAEKNLKSLESRQSGEISADALEQTFSGYTQQANGDAAFQLLSQNRELIKQKYLPQRLAISVANSAAADRTEKIKTLQYLGNLEKERIGDLFASDLADFYAGLSEDKMLLVKKAQEAMLNGYKMCLENKFTSALDEFTLARQLFLQAGNIYEANTISLHFIAYCLYNDDKRREAHDLIKQSDSFSRERNYKWFGLMNFYWLLGTQESLGLLSKTEARRQYENALKTAENMQDAFMIQKFLHALVSKSHFVRQNRKTLFYLHRLIEFSNQPNLSVRQKFRNFDKVIEILNSFQLKGLSKAVVLESVSLAEVLTDPLFAIGSEITAGTVHTKTGNFEEAEQLFLKAERNAKNLQDETQQKSQLAAIFLHLGNLERKRADYQTAAGYYTKSLNLSEKTNTPPLLYETKKSKLLADQLNGNDAEVENNIASTIELAENYRREILDEQDRNSFFDNEQTVYDVAVEHELRKNRTEQAYNYAEFSNSRSLLDWMQKGAKVSADAQKTNILFDESTKPLEIGEIKKRIPPSVQIVQFTVLENKVVIWLITNEIFSVTSTEISSGELKGKVENYLKLIKSNDRASENELKAVSAELFRILIQPILAQLQKNKKICLIPNKFLFNLPVSALVSANGNYFLEDFELFYAPSANVFLSCTKNAENKAKTEDERIFSVGNPAFDKKEFPDLPYLPESEIEAREITKNYRETKLLLGKDATKNAFRQFYKDFDVIHFAGHYIVQPDSPLQSTLVLAKNSENEKENLLTNVELLGEKLLNTKLVVLSACQTGVEGYYNGEGSIGLSRTFLSLGVPLVVASQWQVDSEATDQLMRKFHYYRRQTGLSTNQALRQSQLDMLKTPGGKFGSPYFWAAFAAFGGNTEF